MYDIIIGRDEEERRLFKNKGAIFLGRSYVTMGQTVSLSNNVFMDINRAHVITVCGKRGSGKSYTLSVMAEELMRLEESIKKSLAFLFFDTMGIFWTMKYPNVRQEKLLEKWGMKPEDFDVDIYIPLEFYDKHKRDGFPVNEKFAIKTSELSAGDWCNVFNIDINSAIGVLIERTINSLRKNYSIDGIIEKIKTDKKSTQEIKDSAENRFQNAKGWGLFSNEGTEIKDLVKPGKISILDISCYTEVSGAWSIKALVIGLISRKLLGERMSKRKIEELNTINRSGIIEEMPLVWILIDEAHEFLPREGETPATAALVQLLREGRQPGISLVLATQQPGEIHKDVLTQSDMIISHRLTSKMDIEALNSMMQTYLLADIQKYLNELPSLKGSAIVLDDNSERIYPIRVHPKRSWHGGEAPSAVKIKRGLFEEL